MGCDIHVYSEKKNADGKWVMWRAYSYPDKCQERSYQRFAALAGVRGHGPEANGLPDDVSDSVKEHALVWGGDGHNHCHMPIKKCAEVFLATEYNASEFAKEYPCAEFFGIECDQSEDADDVWRVVFWFDN